MEFKHTIEDHKRAISWLIKMGLMKHVLKMGVNPDTMQLVIAANAM